MNRKTVIFCTGLSGTGKSYFINNYLLPTGTVHNLKSATTRNIREGEKDGREYYFRDEKYFDETKLVTRLFVNAAFWKPGEPKWLYGVPESEVLDNLGYNFAYDVIQPMYIRQMQNWFAQNPKTKDYDFRILWFQPMTNNFEIAESRKNMPNDMAVRKQNTCNQSDFDDANLSVDHIVVCNKNTVAIDARLREFLKQLEQTR